MDNLLLLSKSVAFSIVALNPNQQMYIFGCLLVGNFEVDSVAIINRIRLAQRRKKGCKPRDCVRWLLLKGAISFDVMKLKQIPLFVEGMRWAKEVLIY
jgi:hypothetical protein